MKAAPLSSLASAVTRRWSLSLSHVLKKGLCSVIRGVGSDLRILNEQLAPRAPHPTSKPLSPLGVSSWPSRQLLPVPFLGPSRPSARPVYSLGRVSHGCCEALGTAPVADVRCLPWGSRLRDPVWIQLVVWARGGLNTVWSLMAADRRILTGDVSCITVTLVKLIGWMGLSFWLSTLRSQDRVGTQSPGQCLLLCHLLSNGSTTSPRTPNLTSVAVGSLPSVPFPSRDQTLLLL